MDTRLLLAATILVSAFFISQNWKMNVDEGLDEKVVLLEETIKRLEQQAALGVDIQLERVAVGYNTNLDLVCSGVYIMNLLEDNMGELEPTEAYESISTLREFGKSFAHFFKQGSAAERAITNKELWSAITSPLYDTAFDGCTVLPGGNAALIANRLASLNISILLGGPVGEELEKLIHPSIKTLRKHHESLNKEDFFPHVEDEIHLIMEYSTGENWGNFHSPRANRFIVSHDLQNSHLSAMEDFHDAILSFEPQVVIIAGSHLLEVLGEEERSARLAALEATLLSVPRHIAIHLEIAGVGDAAFLEEMATTLLPLVDSLGLNEQELGGLYLSLGGLDHEAHEFVTPSVQVVANAIDFIMAIPFLRTGTGNHELNRVHLHYLSFHIIGQTIAPRKEVYQWNPEHARKAVAAGSLATTIQACGENNQLPPISELHTRPNGVEGLFSEFQTKTLTFWVAPVAVCNLPKRTVGLGDCISATGLAHHYTI